MIYIYLLPLFLLATQINTMENDIYQNEDYINQCLPENSLIRCRYNYEKTRWFNFGLFKSKQLKACDYINMILKYCSIEGLEKEIKFRKKYYNDLIPLDNIVERFDEDLNKRNWISTLCVTFEIKNIKNSIKDILSATNDHHREEEFKILVNTIKAVLKTTLEKKDDILKKIEKEQENKE